MYESKSIPRTMAAEAVFFTIMFVVFVGYVFVMHGMKRSETNVNGRE